ncbi:13569_t:CDS:2 [Gigaspora margarita]|uniref:13569_t:CDS:1 n=1 Tax=Gigaspora margarita TaxID=4874 RepID=A0ABN7UKK6_GIGMA|nr:13569_t:CDS:2 [Gigaspora margarita]
MEIELFCDCSSPSCLLCLLPEVDGVLVSAYDRILEDTCRGLVDNHFHNVNNSITNLRHQVDEN